MLFNIYGELSGCQLLGWLMVFVGLIVTNELARRSKSGGIFFFFILPMILTVYFIAIGVGVRNGSSWALENQTYLFMNGWFHYAKLYAALAGAIGFMMIKYRWGIGKKEWFKPFPFVIVAINILIAVGSDIESAINGYIALNDTGSRYWYSNEGVWLYGGWWNWVNALAGLLNIFCMTGWFGIYRSKDKNHSDMLWPDMTWAFIISYDIWNFNYTYMNLPTHSWYCGLALLLAPTFAAMFWNKGAWIQNRANTLAIWCMFAQVFPLFMVGSSFSVVPSLYGDWYSNGLELAMSSRPDFADPTMQGVLSLLALTANVLCLGYIIKRSKKMHRNPYIHEIWTGTRDYEEAYSRVEK